MATTFEAIAEPNRRRILELLADRERPVGELVARSRSASRRCPSTCGCCATPASSRPAATLSGGSTGSVPSRCATSTSGCGLSRLWAASLDALEARLDEIPADPEEDR